MESIAPNQTVVESVDLFDSCYGRFGDLMSMPWLTGSTWDRPLYALRDLLRQNEPDVVLVTAPIYQTLIEEVYCDGREKNFGHLAFVSDIKEGLPLWLHGSTDLYLVTNGHVLEGLKALGVPEKKIEVTGYPVAPAFARMTKKDHVTDLAKGARPSVLYLINGARKKAPKLLDHFLKHPEWDVTVSVGHDTTLDEMAREKASLAPHHLTVIGQKSLHELIKEHHIIVSRADEEIVGAIAAARCPLIAFPDKKDFTLLRQANASVTAKKPREVIDWLNRAFRDHAKLWSLWRHNLAPLGQPDASLRMAQRILDFEVTISVPVAELHSLPSPRLKRVTRVRVPKKLLLCDLHTHTTWSDGKLSVAEMVDFYGQREFDCLCITDHLCDPKRLLGKLVNFTGLVIPPDQIGEYFADIERQKKRAWEKYDLLLMSGVEFNKDGYTPKTSTHLLGVDLKQPIDPSLNIKELISEIHAQGGLAIASHPHEMKSAWGKNTLYLWENQEEYAPLLDAWEVANRDDIFNPVGLKKMPFIANSDFHKPKHIHSWKTVLYCEKDAEAIKHCIRVNRDVSLTLYRDHRFGWEEQAVPEVKSEPKVIEFEKTLVKRA